MSPTELKQATEAVAKAVANWRDGRGKCTGIKVPAEIAQALRQLRPHFISNAELGRAVGFGSSTLTKIFNGSKAPAINTLADTPQIIEVARVNLTSNPQAQKEANIVLRSPKGYRLSLPICALNEANLQIIKNIFWEV